MLGHWTRILSLVTLLAAAVVLTGAAPTVAALVTSATVDTCCPGGARGTADRQLPCTTPDCTCPLCLSAAVLPDAHLIEIRPLPVPCHPLPAPGFLPQEFPVPIEYPPETA